MHVAFLDAMKSSVIVPGLFLVVQACASASPVRDDDMSATRHRQMAAREEANAASETRAYEHSSGRPDSDPAEYDRKDEHRRKAEDSREHAREHAASAAFLEQFEDDACAGIAPSGRAACPLLGPLVRLDDIPGGVRATFLDSAHVRPAIAEMRCHYAFARARHFDEAVHCPLYVRGIEIRPGLDPREVEIVAHDEATARLIRQRSRAEAVVVHRDR
jgi:hypothetical protein